MEGRFPPCAFANVVLWNQQLAAFEYRDRRVSLNRVQTKLEPDGSFRMVIAHRDPGVPNWLDTEGHAEGTMFWRFLLPEAKPEKPRCRVVPVGSLARSSAAAPRRFEPTLESLRTHEVPAWYHDAKLGIFVHWTMASVPAFAPRESRHPELLRDALPRAPGATRPYVEWYENSLKLPGQPGGPPSTASTTATRPYAEFRDDVRARRHRAPRPRRLGRARSRAAGARYVVFVTKHHDGYCLWPSRVREPAARGLGGAARLSSASSPRRCARAGMRFGVYYSGGLDWTFEPAPDARRSAT